MNLLKHSNITETEEISKVGGRDFNSTAFNFMLVRQRIPPCLSLGRGLPHFLTHQRCAGPGGQQRNRTRRTEEKEGEVCVSRREKAEQIKAVTGEDKEDDKM